MRDALIGLLTSKKVITTIAALLIAGAARYGFDVSEDTALAVLGLFAVLIGAQGAADAGKEAAKHAADVAWRPSAEPVAVVQPPPLEGPPGATWPKDGSGRVDVVTLVALVVALVSIAACDTLSHSAKRAAGGVVDCLKPEAKGLALELAPTFGDLLEGATGDDGKIDWAPVRKAAGALTSDATRCAFSAAFAELLKAGAALPGRASPFAPQSSGLEADPIAARAGFESIRAELFGGAAFKLEGGTL